MKTRPVTAITFVAALLLTTLTSHAILTDSSDRSDRSNEDTAAVEAATHGFYSALNDMFTGDIEPMLQVWSHRDDVTYMGPAGGLLVGWEDVRASWEKQAALELGGHVESSDLQIRVGRDVAMVQNTISGENEDSQGETQAVSIRATSVFRMEAGEWKMISHHTDLLPFLD